MRIPASTSPLSCWDWHPSLRASDVELGAIAAVAQPKLLVLHHIVRNVEDNDELLESIRAAGFEGEVVVAKDMDRL